MRLQSNILVDNIVQFGWDNSRVIHILNDEYLVTGGNNSASNVSAQTWQLQPNTGKLYQKANMNIARVGHGLARVGEQIYCLGGDFHSQYPGSFECYSLSQNSWQMLPSCYYLSSLNCFDSLISLSKSFLYVFGVQNNTLIIGQYDTLQSQEWFFQTIQLDYFTGQTL